jgi:hypothetical protein
MRPEEADQRHIRRVAPPRPRRSARYWGLLFPGSKPVADTDGAAVKRVPDVLECHLMAGTADYLLKVVAQMHSSFALRTVFKTTALPV